MLGENTCLGAGLRIHLLRWGRHEIVTLPSTNGHWKSERKLVKSLRKIAPDIIIDLRFSAGSEELLLPNELDLQTTEWISRACERENFFLLLISNPSIFSGKKINPYTENDTPDSVTDAGVFMFDNEQKLRKHCKRHIILRLGPVFAAYGENLLTDLISNIEEREELFLSSHKRHCPLHASDGARVISGMIDQISAGANGMGTFHYCGSEAVSNYEFSEAVFSSLLQLKLIQKEVSLKPLGLDHDIQNFILDCKKIQSCFAIKQIPWKQFLSEAVKNFYSAR